MEVPRSTAFEDGSSLPVSEAVRVFVADGMRGEAFSMVFWR